MSLKVYKLDEKLPPINEEVVIFSKKKGTFFIGRLLVYDGTQKLQGNNPLKKGDVYWSVYDREDDKSVFAWTTTDVLPFWATKKEVVLELFPKEEKIEGDTRFALLDFQK